jgi:hypothetical protein
MPAAPRIVERAEQPYVAVSGRVTMQTIGAIADRLPEVFAWLGARGLEPAGAPFFKYDLIDMERQLEVQAGVLPAGTYASLTHVGHPDELVEATTALLDWAAQQGLAWDMNETPEGQRWGCRLEVYKTDPAEQPDMTKWETELLFRLAD